MLSREAHRLINHLRYSVSGVRLPGRMSISGKNLLDENGNPWMGAGPNYGEDGCIQIGDFATDYARGGRICRIPVRMHGNYTGYKTDGYDGTSWSRVNLVYMQRMLNLFVAGKASGMKMVLAHDSDCIQNAYQDAPTIAYCNAGLGPGANGYNPQGVPWKTDYAISTEFWSRLLFGYLDMFEVLVEPNPLDSGYTWNDALRLIRYLRAIVRRVDPQMILRQGGLSYRHGNLLTYWDPTWNDGLTMGTYDGLSNSIGDAPSLAQTISDATTFRNAQGVPVDCNQLGLDSSDDGLNTPQEDQLMMAAYEAHRSAGITVQWWEAEPKNLESFGWFYNNPPSGPRVVKPVRYANTTTAWTKFVTNPVYPS